MNHTNNVKHNMTSTEAQELKQIIQEGFEQVDDRLDTIENTATLRAADTKLEFAKMQTSIAEMHAGYVAWGVALAIAVVLVMIFSKPNGYLKRLNGSANTGTKA